MNVQVALVVCVHCEINKNNDSEMEEIHSLFQRDRIAYVEVWTHIRSKNVKRNSSKPRKRPNSVSQSAHVSAVRAAAFDDTNWKLARAIRTSSSSWTPIGVCVLQLQRSQQLFPSLHNFCLAKISRFHRQNALF